MDAFSKKSNDTWGMKERSERGRETEEDARCRGGQGGGISINGRQAAAAKKIQGHQQKTKKKAGQGGATSRLTLTKKTSGGIKAGAGW